MNNGKFEPLEAAVTCISKTIEQKLIHDCELHAEINLKGDSFAFVRLTYDENSDLKTIPVTSGEDTFITSDFETLYY